MNGRRIGKAVALGLTLGLVAGACSATAGSSGSSAPGSTRIIATFVATGGGRGDLSDDARELTVRLGIWGDAGASVEVRNHRLVVTGTSPLPVSTSLLLAPGTFQVRPALSAAGPYVAPPPSTIVGSLPSACSAARYSLLAPNLTVDESTGNSDEGSIAPDPALASYPSTSAAANDSNPDTAVLVAVDAAAADRDLLGPVVLDHRAVASARADSQDAQWLVDVTLTEAGASAWDAVAKQYFHEVLAFDVDGVAVSAPLMQPSQATFTSFDGKIQVSGNLTERTATQLAAILTSGPLTVALSS